MKVKIKISSILIITVPVPIMNGVVEEIRLIVLMLLQLQCQFLLLNYTKFVLIKAI